MTAAAPGRSPAARRPRWPATATATRSTGPTRACGPRTPPARGWSRWDDHEVEDNYAGIVPREDERRRRRSGRVRRPPRRRLPGPGGSTCRSACPHRRRAARPSTAVFAGARLAQFVVLDGRQHRSDQPCGDGFVRSCPERDSPDATMLGAEQEAWLAARFAEAATDRRRLDGARQPGGDDRPVGPTRRRCGPGQHGRLGRLPPGTTPPARRPPGRPRRARTWWCSRATCTARSSGTCELDGATVGSEFLGPVHLLAVPDGPLAAQLGRWRRSSCPRSSWRRGRHGATSSCTVDASRWRTDYRWVRTVARPESDLPDDGPSYVVEAGTPGARPREPGEASASRAGERGGKVGDVEHVQLLHAAGEGDVEGPDTAGLLVDDGGRLDDARWRRTPGPSRRWR